MPWSHGNSSAQPVAKSGLSLEQCLRGRSCGLRQQPDSGVLSEWPSGQKRCHFGKFEQQRCQDNKRVRFPSSLSPRAVDTVKMTKMRIFLQIAPRKGIYNQKACVCQFWAWGARKWSIARKCVFWSMLSLKMVTMLKVCVFVQFKSEKLGNDQKCKFELKVLGNARKGQKWAFCIFWVRKGWKCRFWAWNAGNDCFFTVRAWKCSEMVEINA